MNVATLFLNGDGADRGAPSLGERAGRGSRVAGITLSVVAHAAAIAYAAHWLENADLGAVSVPSEAVTVELMASSVVESVSPTEATTAAAPASVAAAQGNADTDRQAVQADATPPPPAKQPVPTPAETAEPATPDDVPVTEITALNETDAVATKDAPAPKPPVETKKEEKPRRPVEKPKERQRKPDPRRERATESSRRGAQASRGNGGSKSSNARASASAGDVRNYAARVQARIAANKPAGNGMNARVVVRFGVSASGSVTFAQIARSSGNAQLDRAALSAVRGAGPFGPPPPGMNRSFSFPFTFR
jgi:protein TonB